MSVTEKFKILLRKSRFIPKDVQEKAKNELNETDENKKECLSYLRKAIEDKIDIKYGQEIYDNFYDKDDDHLLRFLRSRKFNTKKTYELMRGYVVFRKHYPDLFKMNKEKIADCLKQGYPCILPERDKEGRVVIAFSIGNWDRSAYSFDLILQAYIVLMNQLIQNEESLINGFAVLENFGNYSIGQALTMRPWELKKMVDMFQGSFPGRFKAFHFIYQPWYFTWTYKLVKPFMSSKLASRVFLHGYNLEEFLQNFDKSILPKEHGGEGPEIDFDILSNIIMEGFQNEY